MTNVKTLAGGDPAFVIPIPSPRSITVFARTGAATISTGPTAVADGFATFSISEGEVWQWFIDERVDWVEPATITAIGGGAQVIVMWQRMKATGT